MTRFPKFVPPHLQCLRSIKSSQSCIFCERLGQEAERSPPRLSFTISAHRSFSFSASSTHFEQYRYFLCSLASFELYDTTWLLCLKPLLPLKPKRLQTLANGLRLLCAALPVHSQIQPDRLFFNLAGTVLPFIQTRRLYANGCVWQGHLVHLR